MPEKKINYKSAGVDIDAGNKAVELIKDKVKNTHSKDVLTGIGSFGSLLRSSDLFDWIEPCVNLTAIGRRISTEAQRITDAGRKRHSVFANGGKVGVAERIARRKPTAFVRR